MIFSDGDIAWVTGILGRMTYKTGWTISISDPDYYNSMYLLIEFTAPDARGSGNFIKIRSQTPMPTMTILQRNEQGFFRFIQKRLLTVEHHESLEWFRVDGELYDDPHKGR